MRMNKNIIEYDLVRTYALLFVLLGHCTYNAIMTDYGGVDIGVDGSLSCIMQKGLCFLSTVFYKFHMPLFVALSGCLWAVHLQKKGLPTFMSVWQGKSKRLLIPFLVAALFWSIPIKYISGYWDNAGDDTLLQIIVGQILMFGDFNSHLWFVQALFWVFLLSWSIERFHWRNNTRVFSCILFLASICCMYIHVKFRIELLNVLTAFQYLLWFYVGFYFEQYREQVNDFILKHVSWMICISAIFAYVFLIFTAGHLPRIPGFNTVSVYIFAPIGMILTYAACYKSLTITPPPYLLNIITKISKESYGVYLYSDPINYIILMLVSDYSLQWIYSDNLGALSIYLIRFFVTTIGAWGVILITRKFNYRV